MEGVKADETTTTTTPDDLIPSSTRRLEEVPRRSLQDEFAKLVKDSIQDAYYNWEEVSCSISPCPKEDFDYQCTYVVDTWPETRKDSLFKGPTHAALCVRDTAMLLDETSMIERCVVCGPGVLLFKLSMTWIAQSIHKIVKEGMDIYAPNVSSERAILYDLSGNIAEKMHMGRLRSTVIGETLARILQYSGVEVIRRHHEKDVLELTMMMEYLIEKFPNKIVNDLSPRELEVLSMESKKKYCTDFEFRKRAEKGWQETYERLGILSEGEKFSVDLAALWHALNVVKADTILHVDDVRQRDHFEMCISDAKRAGWFVNDSCPPPLSHVGFGLVQADDYERLLDEAKIRWITLVEQGTADECTTKELEDTAEALAYGAVKYAVLKNNRLTNCRISFDEIMNEKGNTLLYLHYTHRQVCSITTEYTGDIKRLKKLEGEKLEELTLKNNEERELGLHLLRFTEVIGEVCTVRMPHILCEYLYNLCQKFHSFYSCVSQVVGYGNETTKLLLCEATEQAVRKCFHLLAITPIPKKIKLLRPGSERPKRLYFSDLTEQQLMESFCEGPCFRFDLSKVDLRHNIDNEVENRSSYNELTLYGIIQAETCISEPSHYEAFSILNRNFDNPLVITKPGSFSPRDLSCCSLSVSTFVKIIAKLYGTTTYNGDGIETYDDYVKCLPPKGSDPKSDDAKKKVYLDDDVLHVCDGHLFINFIEYFANRPDGGSGYSQLKGNDGYLDLYYVALKYAVEAALEIDFVATSKETKVFGRVKGYYGNNFSYDCCASMRYNYDAMLFETKQGSHIHPGKIDIFRSALGVPAKHSLIIDAELRDFTSGDIILLGVWEFFVPVDGSTSVGYIFGKDCLLKVKVDWKLPLLRELPSF